MCVCVCVCVCVLGGIIIYKENQHPPFCSSQAATFIFCGLLKTCDQAARFATFPGQQEITKIYSDAFWAGGGGGGGGNNYMFLFTELPMA